MKKTVAAVAIGLMISSTTFSQKEKEVKYEKLYYKDLKLEGEKVTITVDNAVSTPGETKFKLKITNLTGDYIIFKPEECKFVINGKELKPKEKWLIIKPNDSDFRIINLKGDNYNTVKNYSFLADGLYTVSLEEKALTTPDFKLPPSSNDFKTGNFNCTLSSLTKETDKTEAKFKCAYVGQKVGIINPAKAPARMPDGYEYANAKSKSGPILLMKGEDDSFTCKWERMEGGKKMDMQKVEMNVIWRETFTEATPQKLKAETLNLEFDEEVTKAKK